MQIKIKLTTNNFKLTKQYLNLFKKIFIIRLSCFFYKTINIEDVSFKLLYKKQKYGNTTVIRSPHIFKKSKESFRFSLRHVILKIAFLNKNLSSSSIFFFLYFFLSEFPTLFFSNSSFVFLLNYQQKYIL